MHVKNADMYPMARQKLPSGETMLSFPTPTNPAVASNVSAPIGSALSPNAAPASTLASTNAKYPSNFAMVMNENDRMAGSVPVWNGTPFKDTNEINIDASSTNGTKKDDEFGFADFIDIINPLQHIPIISQIYRAITDDVINPVAEVVGGGLFGGPIGAATGAASAAFAGPVGDDLKKAFAGVFSSEHNYNDTTIAITSLNDPSRYNQ